MIYSTRSTKCLKKTPKSSCGTTSKRAESSCVGLPLFSAHGDPGPSFWHFAQMSGLEATPREYAHEAPHATTVIAVRYVGGVVMVGDRQATGNYIASRDVRKIEAADNFTAIAISGTAGR